MRRWFITPVHDEQALMWINTADYYVSRGCVEDSWEPDETNFIRQFLKRGDAFVDIGANIGWFTTLAALIVGPDGSVTAFEPQPVIKQYLSRTVEVNKFSDRITVNGVGLWSIPQELAFAWSIDSINPGGAHIREGGSAEFTIECRTLDSFALDRCNLIKIDVEGAEPHVFRGACETLARHRPLILSELHPGQLRLVSDCSTADYLSLMAGLGYQARILGGPNHGTAVDGNDPRWSTELASVVFLPEERGQLVF